MRITCSILLISLTSIVTVLQVGAAPPVRIKSNGNNTERQHDYQEAASALKSQNFLLSLYSFVDKTGNMTELEPEGNFILVNKDKFLMQKSIKLIVDTFAGSDNFKGDFLDYRFKVSRNGNIQFSFTMTDGKKRLLFKGKMNGGDHTIIGTLKGKVETHDIIVSGNIQPVQSHFVY